MCIGTAQQRLDLEMNQRGTMGEFMAIGHNVASEAKLNVAGPEICIGLIGSGEKVNGTPWSGMSTR
jgi:hypothetical protein